MKKTLVFGLVALLAAGSVFAGGKQQAGGGAASGQTALKVLNYTDLTAPNSAEGIKIIWDGFAAKYPNIKVEREDLYNEAYHEKVAAYSASGELPDAMYAWPGGRSANLHANHLLKDLTPLIKAEGLDKVYSKASLDVSGQAAGYQAIMPLTVTSSHAFYVNLEVLNALGLKPATTYEELKAQVAPLKAAGKQCVMMDNKSDWVMQSCLFSMLAGRFGGKTWADDIKSGKAKFTDKSFVDALAFVGTLYKDGVISKDTLYNDYGSSRGGFASGKGAYLIDGDWANAAFLTDKSTGQALIPVDRQKNFKITVFPVIAGTKLQKSTSTTLGTGWGINAKIPAGSDKEKAAWELVKWMVSPEIQQYQLETGGITVPVNTKVDTTKLKLEPLQIEIANLPSQYDTGTIVIDAVFDGTVYNPINIGLQEIGDGSKTAQAVAQEAQTAWEAYKKANP